MMKLIWNKPELAPSIDVWSEKEFWLAVELKRITSNEPEVIVFLAQYQNRPYKEGDEESNSCDALVSTDDEYVDSVGWVTRHSHCEFDNYYEPIVFGDNYKLLGWAEYKAPEFKPQVQ